MAALFTDENMALALELALRDLGHLMFSTYDEGRAGAPDPHQLLYAAERGWVLITHNRRDFRLLHDAWLLWSRSWGVRPTHAGILVLEQVPGMPIEDLGRLVHDLVTDPKRSLATALYNWRPATGWVRFPS